MFVYYENFVYLIIINHINETANTDSLMYAILGQIHQILNS